MQGLIWALLIFFAMLLCAYMLWSISEFLSTLDKVFSSNGKKGRIVDERRGLEL